MYNVCKTKKVIVFGTDSKQSKILKMREFFPFCLDILNLNEDVSPGGAVRPGNIFTMPESPQGCRPQYLLRSAIHKLLSYEPLLLKIIMCPLSGKKNCNL